MLQFPEASDVPKQRSVVRMALTCRDNYFGHGDENKCTILTPEQRKFCSDIYNEIRSENNWHSRFSSLFLERFSSAVSVPTEPELVERFEVKENTVKNAMYTPEQRKFSFDVYNEIGGQQRWYDRFSLMFRQKFPEAGRAPSSTQVRNITEKFDEFGDFENHMKGKCGQ